MSAWLGGGNRRAPLLVTNRRGTVVGRDPEEAAAGTASPDRPDPSPRRGRALLLTTVTGLGLAAALGAGAFVVAGKGDASAAVGEPTAAVTVASADAVPDLSALRAAMTARTDHPAVGTEQQAAPAPELRDPPAAAPVPVKEAASGAEPVVAAVAAPAASAVEPQTAPSLPSPAAPPAAPAITAAEAAILVKRAKGLIEHGDVAAARRFLERAAAGGDGAALFALAETHDPAVLDRWRVHGVKADVSRARDLYRQAAERGVGASAARLAALR